MHPKPAKPSKRSPVPRPFPLLFGVESGNETSRVHAYNMLQLVPKGQGKLHTILEC